MSTRYSVGQMNQLGDAFEAADFTVDEVTKLRTFPDLAALKGVLKGLAKIVVVKHIIDCDADSFVPENWKVESHKKCGQLEWNPESISLYLSAGQKDGKCIEGNKLREELASKPVLNANVLDYLLAHPELIPEEWKGKYVFFWGTIYRGPDGDLDVRDLYWGGGGWYWDYRWLGPGFGDDFPAALSASI